MSYSLRKKDNKHLERRTKGCADCYKLVLLSAIDLARHEAFAESRGGKPPSVINVTAKHMERALKNKEEYNDNYKRATGLYPDQMAAERFLRAERNDRS